MNEANECSAKDAVGAMLSTLMECGYSAQAINEAFAEYGYARRPRREVVATAPGDCPSYVIETIDDMLKVPTASRDAMLRDIGLALDLHQLTFGDEPAKIGPVTWTDDGNPSVTIDDMQGKRIVSMEVKSA